MEKYPDFVDMYKNFVELEKIMRFIYAYIYAIDCKSRREKGQTLWLPSPEVTSCYYMENMTWDEIVSKGKEYYDKIIPNLENADKLNKLIITIELDK